VGHITSRTRPTRIGYSILMKNFDGWTLTDAIAYIGKLMSHSHASIKQVNRTSLLAVERRKKIDSRCDYCHTGCDICMGYPAHTEDL